MLGDAFLKFGVCVSLFLLHPRHTEGELSATKNTTVSNASLCQHAAHFPAGRGGLHAFLRTRSLKSRLEGSVGTGTTVSGSR
jgi:dsRNA-specific ribonuclease